MFYCFYKTVHCNFLKHRPSNRKKYANGAVAQLGERLNGIQEVVGSIPSGSTVFPRTKEENAMDMFIKVVRDNYTNFEGRARRNEYWMFTLVAVIINIGTFVLDSKFFPGVNLLSNLFSLAILLPGVAVGARRLHDIGKSGWWQLLWLVPILGWVALLIMLTTDSGIGQNDYGTSEKYPDDNDSDDDFFLGEEE